MCLRATVETFLGSKMVENDVDLWSLSSKDLRRDNILLQLITVKITWSLERQSDSPKNSGQVNKRLSLNTSGITSIIRPCTSLIVQFLSERVQTAGQNNCRWRLRKKYWGWSPALLGQNGGTSYSHAPRGRVGHCFQNQLWGICSTVALQQLQLLQQGDWRGRGGTREVLEEEWARKVERTLPRRLSANQEAFPQKRFALSHLLNPRKV